MPLLLPQVNTVENLTGMPSFKNQGSQGARIFVLSGSMSIKKLMEILHPDWQEPKSSLK